MENNKYIMQDFSDKLYLNLKEFYEKYDIKTNNPSRDMMNVFERYGLSDFLIKDANDNVYKIPYLVQDILQTMFNCYKNDPLYNKKNITLDDILKHNGKILDNIEDFDKKQNLTYYPSNIKASHIYEYNKELQKSIDMLRNRLVVFFEILFSETFLLDKNRINEVIWKIDNILFDCAEVELEKAKGLKKNKYKNAFANVSGYFLDLVLREEFCNQFTLNTEIEKILEKEKEKYAKRLTDDTEIENFLKCEGDPEAIYKWYRKYKLNEIIEINESMDEKEKNKYSNDKFLIDEAEDFIDKYIEENIDVFTNLKPKLDNSYNRRYKGYVSDDKYMSYSHSIYYIIFNFFLGNISEIIKDTKKLYNSLKESESKTLEIVSKKISTYEFIEENLLDEMIANKYDDRYKYDIYTKFYCKAYSYFYKFGFMVMDNYNNIFEEKITYILENILKDECYNLICKGEDSYIKENSDFLSEDDKERIMDNSNMIILKKIYRFLLSDEKIKKEDEKFEEAYQILKKLYKDVEDKHNKKIKKYVSDELKIKHKIEEYKNKIENEDISEKEIEKIEKKIKKQKNEEEKIKDELYKVKDIYTYISNALGISMYNALESDIKFMQDKKNKVNKKDLLKSEYKL